MPRNNGKEKNSVAEVLTLKKYSSQHCNIILYFSSNKSVVFSIIHRIVFVILWSR